MPSLTITFAPEHARRPYRVLLLCADGGEVALNASDEAEAIAHVARMLPKLRVQEPAPAVPVADPSGAAGAGADAEVAR